MAEDLKKKCRSEKLGMGAVATGSTSKKRKFQSISDEFENGTENVSLAISESDGDDTDTASDSSDPNLEEDDVGTETSMYNSSCERSSTVEVLEESDEEISPSPDDLGEVITPPIKPPEKELEEFFAALEKQIREKQLQEKFAEKYNFDIMNDVPMEGRLEWIALN